MWSMFVVAAIFSSNLKYTVAKSLSTADLKIYSADSNQMENGRFLDTDSWFIHRLGSFSPNNFQGDNAVINNFIHESLTHSSLTKSSEKSQTNPIQDIKDDSGTIFTNNLQKRRSKRHTGYLSFCHFKICNLGKKGTKYLTTNKI